MADSIDLFRENFKTKLLQYVYTSLESPSDSLLAVLQVISGQGNLNWHLPENKEKLAKVFSKYSEAISTYELAHGDFRSYCLNNLILIIVTEYEQELVNLVLGSTYNISPDSALPALSPNYSTQMPQNSNFPDKVNTSSDFDPGKDDIRLLPKSLYPTELD